MEFGDVGFTGGRKTGEPGEKPSEQGVNQRKLNPHMTLGWNQTQDTLVGGESLNPAPPEACLLTIWTNRGRTDFSVQMVKKQKSSDVLEAKLRHKTQ